MSRHSPQRTIAYWADRAEKAEAERDEARRHECGDLDAHWRLDEALASLREANATVAALRAEQPRPLTPDAITDEMVERAFGAADHYAAVVINKTIMREALAAALTEPPQRPEGAEEIESAIRAWDENGDTNADHGDWDNLADFLASRGVRVVTEDGER